MGINISSECTLRTEQPQLSLIYYSQQLCKVLLAAQDKEETEA